MMEKILKERIIGAIVLVAVAVLIVPVFLDGPPADGEIISEVIPLPGQSDQKTQTIVLDRDRKEPVPVPSAAAPDRREQGPATTASAPRKSAPASQEDTSQPQRSQDRPDSATATPLTSAGSTTGRTPSWGSPPRTSWQIPPGRKGRPRSPCSTLKAKETEGGRHFPS